MVNVGKYTIYIGKHPFPGAMLNFGGVVFRPFFLHFSNAS